MDFKVDVGNVLPGDHPAAENAARWLREHFDIPVQFTLFDEFEQYFDCRIDVDDRKDNWMMPNKIIFENRADLMMFILRWS
jgi:hypothetical protein